MKSNKKIIKLLKFKSSLLIFKKNNKIIKRKYKIYPNSYFNLQKICWKLNGFYIISKRKNLF